MATLARVAAPRLALGGASLVGLLAASHAAADIPFSAVSALLPTIQARFGLTESVLALLVATLSFGASMTQPLFGALADRIGPRLVGAAGVVLSSVLLALVGIAPSVWLVLALLLTGGLASAAMHPAFTSLSRSTGASRPSLAVSLYSAGGTFGVAIGPIAVLTVMSTLGVAGTPWLMMPGIALGIATYLVVPAGRDERVARPPMLDMQLVAGPLGVLTIAAALASVPFVAFGASIGLWLVAEHGVARDAALIGWTLSAFALAAAAGGVIAASLASRVSARLAVSSTMVAAVVPLFAIFSLAPGSPLYFVAVMAAGALLNASLPIMVVTAQNLVPRSVAAASGMLMGFAHGIAGLLYIGVGALQEAAGTGTAMAATYLLVIPAAALAFGVLTRVSRSSTNPVADCRCRVCRCTYPVACACASRAAD
jgi:FSR family fosmidomycin resistance protein-like MFS transporter